MPIYEFKCLDCSQVSEVFVRSSEQALRCPDCGSGNLEKLVSASYMIKSGSQAAGTTCCGRNERCDAPPCSTGDTCRRY
ncbi:MAG TPA: zinc ribbon domain-containing protein [Dehalococcoidia bacterium]|nr:zinc ribbon domain-containing protein [Dehalococcoidia bacterium]